MTRMTTVAALSGFIVLCSLSCADAELYNYGDAGTGKLCAWNGQGTPNTKTVTEAYWYDPCSGWVCGLGDCNNWGCGCKFIFVRLLRRAPAPPSPFPGVPFPRPFTHANTPHCIAHIIAQGSDAGARTTSREDGVESKARSQ